MDIRNFTWVNTFELKSTSSDPSTPISPTTSAKTTNPSENLSDGKNQLSINVVIGIVASAIIGTVAFMTMGIFGYKWYQRKRHNDIMRIHGNI